MFIRALVIGAFILVSIILWMPAWQELSISSEDFEQELRPEFTAKLLHQELFDKNGKLTQEVFSQRMEHFAELQLTHFEQPEFVIYQSQHPLWRLSAEIGTMQDGILTLDQNVKMVQLVANSLVQTITTEYLEIDLDSNKVSTDDQIHIDGQRMSVIGNGMHADLNVGSVSLTQHVTTLIKGKNE